MKRQRQDAEVKFSCVWGIKSAVCQLQLNQLVNKNRQAQFIKNMKTKTYIIAFALSIFAFGAVLQAQETQPSQGAVLAEELLTLLNVQKNLDATFSQISKMRDQSSSSTNATAEVKEMQQKMRETMDSEMKAMVNWDKIKPIFISIYSETFTPEELQGMIAFYKTPIGQKWLEKQPQVQMATMQKMQSIMAEAVPKMQEAMKRAMEPKKEEQ